MTEPIFLHPCESAGDTDMGQQITDAEADQNIWPRLHAPATEPVMYHQLTNEEFDQWLKEDRERFPTEERGPLPNEGFDKYSDLGFVRHSNEEFDQYPSEGSVQYLGKEIVQSPDEEELIRSLIDGEQTDVDQLLQLHNHDTGVRSNIYREITELIYGQCPEPAAGFYEYHDIADGQMDRGICAFEYPDISLSRFAAEASPTGWDDLPLELQFKIVGYFTKVEGLITAHNRSAVVRQTNLLCLGQVSRTVKDVVEQSFYQLNSFALQPTRSRPFSGLSLWYPPLQVNHYIKRLDFHDLLYEDEEEEQEETPTGNALVVLPFNMFARPRPRASNPQVEKKVHNDTWQLLKNIALGKNGFPSLDHVRVFFQAEPHRMQAFWAWNICVKSGDKDVVVCPDDKDWEDRLKAALKDAPTSRIGAKQPGFELRRVTSKKVQAMTAQCPTSEL
ncbi:hypothetical protein BDV95DRAFT_591143 [Massariosphaeria phaeospora]|uniref:Uncharacterized protein n=1 Tax=Massariosphaeria phaeospora TaxID=100035 RepID=A0A7C8IF77_9PLEO|nr:hypothetical protein BDV95DRAFT_591143 [Massariosphaeria phaeospora]